jgi:hypothetical protein
MTDKRTRLLKRIEALAMPDKWGLKERDAVCEILRALVEEVFPK